MGKVHEIFDNPTYDHIYHNEFLFRIKKLHTGGHESGCACYTEQTAPVALNRLCLFYLRFSRLPVARLILAAIRRVTKGSFLELIIAN